MLFYFSWHTYIQSVIIPHVLNHLLVFLDINPTALLGSPRITLEVTACVGFLRFTRFMVLACFGVGLIVRYF
jgi:hypothetical protein